MQQLIKMIIHNDSGTFTIWKWKSSLFKPFWVRSHLRCILIHIIFRQEPLLVSRQRTFFAGRFSMVVFGRLAHHVTSLKSPERLFVLDEGLKRIYRHFIFHLRRHLLYLRLFILAGYLKFQPRRKVQLILRYWILWRRVILRF